MNDTPVNHRTIAYAGSVDGESVLLADCAWRDDGTPKPLVLVIHGYGGKRWNVARDIDELAAQGIFAVAPDMRGRGDSHGQWDSGGLDVHDAVDAALVAVEQFGSQIDARRINIIGYSGGGGIAYSAGCRFPDLFQNAISFFGICDYERWRASNGRPDCNRIMDAAIGTPETHPARYEARNMVPAAGNAMKTRWWIFWDDQETACPPDACDEPWIAAYRAAGGRRLHRMVSTPTDVDRWFHGYRTNHDSLSRADRLYVPDILADPVDLSLPDAGELVVPGYVVTRHFSVFVGGGTEGRLRIRYRLTPDPTVEILDNPRGLPFEIHLGTPTSRLPQTV